MLSNYRVQGRFYTGIVTYPPALHYVFPLEVGRYILFSSLSVLSQDGLAFNGASQGSIYSGDFH